VERVGEVWSQLAFRHPFRRYQRFALRHVDEVRGTEQDDGRFHLVAPPGSGKTILGLELVRRFERPALVLAPTTAIVQQWRAQVALFLPDGADLDAVVSTDPARLAPITVLTYQVLSTPATAEPVVREAAREVWLEELVTTGRVPDLAAGEARLATLHANNRRTFDRELARRTRRHKRRLLREGDASIRRFLHGNARDLLDRLTGHEVGTVVLDECHHLLDHWAVVVRSLVDGLDEPAVVGLTATLPDPDTPEEFENYHELLGDVDIEVPTPAVVKEGELAPFRDNVYVVEPTRAEDRYLADVEGAFERAVVHVTEHPGFRRWLRAAVEDDEGEVTADGVIAVLRADPVLGLARLRLLVGQGVDLGDVPVPRDAREPAAADDRARTVAAYALEELTVSADPADHELVDELRRALRPFGFTLTERGLRQIRAPGDLVLAYSEAKQEAAADVLELEAEALGDRLRAVVVTDFERTGRGVATVGEALASDAGSARRVFRALLERPALAWLEPVLLTGRTVWIDEAVAEDLLGFAREWFEREGYAAALTTEPCDVPRAVALVGRGADWSPRTYVRMLTAAFEAGVTRCLVGTRGLLGEGWDALALNTLIDLTSVTTAQSVQQLRGRSLRLDPSWPRKVAHNWDIVCVDTDRAHGDRDLRRFVRRHARYWGVAELPPVRRVLDGATLATPLQPAGTELVASPSWHGRIVRGVAHVDLPLAEDLAGQDWWKVRFDRATTRSLRRIGRRDRSYELWRVGEPYDDAHGWTADLQLRRRDVRSAHTVSGLVTQLLRALRGSLVGTAVFLLFQGLHGVAHARTADVVVWGGVLALVAAVGSLVLNARTIGEVGRALLREQPPDAIVGDVGRAVLEGLRDAELVDRRLTVDQMRVAVDERGMTSVLLEHASEEDSGRFVRACAQVLGPVVDPRYLIRRDDRRLPAVGARWLWVPLRTALARRLGEPVGYHAVPDDLGVNRGRAEAFARAWARHVGGGELIHTRSDDGWRALLEARAAERPTATSLTYERWW
jgi:superfamily II DNA or RNA helicase